MIERIGPSILTAIETTRSWIKNFEKFKEITELDEIARRCFVINAFDGLMTMLGMTVGISLSNITDYNVIISSGLGVCIAMGISGASGAYMAEKAERTKDLQELEDVMFTNLENSLISEASQFAVVFIALINGISPVITSLVSLAPFFMVRTGILNFAMAIRASIALTLLTLFMLGVFLGKISRENVLRKGLLMAAAGLISALLIILLSIVF